MVMGIPSAPQRETPSSQDGGTESMQECRHDLLCPNPLHVSAPPREDLIGVISLQHEHQPQHHMSDHESTALTKEQSNNPVEIRNLDDLKELSEIFVKSGFFDDTKDIAQASVKILAGMEVDIPPMTAMREIHCHNGKTELSGPLLAALIKRSSKYDYKIVGVNSKGAKIAFYEHGEHIGDASFTLNDAKEAGLMRKTNWQKYRKDMYVWRAMARGKRWYCPEIGHGSLYLEGEEIPSGDSDTRSWMEIDVESHEEEVREEFKEADVEVEDVEDEPSSDDDNGESGKPDFNAEVKAMNQQLQNLDGDDLRSRLDKYQEDVQTWPTSERKKAFSMMDNHIKRWEDSQGDDNDGTDYEAQIAKLNSTLSGLNGSELITAIKDFRGQIKDMDWPNPHKKKANHVLDKHAERWSESQDESSENDEDESNSDVDDSSDDGLDNWDERMEKCNNGLESKLDQSKGGTEPLDSFIKQLGGAIANTNASDKQVAEFQRALLPYRTIVRLRHAITTDGVNEKVFNEVLNDFVDALNDWKGTKSEAKEAHDMVLNEANRIADNIDGFEVTLEKDEDDDEDEDSQTRLILPNDTLPDGFPMREKLIANGYKKTKVVQDAIDRGVISNIKGIGESRLNDIQSALDNLKKEIKVSNADSLPF